MHILSDANGLPLIVGLSAANVHDSLALKPMVEVTRRCLPCRAGLRAPFGSWAVRSSGWFR